MRYCPYELTSSSYLFLLNYSGSWPTCFYRWRASIKCSLEQHFLPKLSGNCLTVFSLSLFFCWRWKYIHMLPCSMMWWYHMFFVFFLLRLSISSVSCLLCSPALIFLEILRQTHLKSLLSKFCGSYVPRFPVCFDVVHSAVISDVRCNYWHNLCRNMDIVI